MYTTAMSQCSANRCTRSNRQASQLQSTYRHHEQENKWNAQPLHNWCSQQQEEWAEQKRSSHMICYYHCFVYYLFLIYILSFIITPFCFVYYFLVLTSCAYLSLWPLITDTTHKTMHSTSLRTWSNCPGSLPIFVQYVTKSWGRAWEWGYVVVWWSNIILGVWPAEKYRNSKKCELCHWHKIVAKNR